MTPQERYDRDPQFHMLVDVLTQHIVEFQYSPTELREAAILAAIRYETIHARPKYLVEDESLKRVDSYHGRDCEHATEGQQYPHNIEERVSIIERWIDARENYEQEQAERS